VANLHHDFLAWPTIDQASVVPSVVVMHDEEGVFQLKGASTHQYQPHMVLLDFHVQPLMLGKAIVDGLGLTNVNFNPCPYHILTLINHSKMAQRLTKQEVVIQVNPTKLMDYCTTMWAGMVVMHATTYDVFVEGAFLYPLTISIDFWEKISYNTTHDGKWDLAIRFHYQ